MPKRKKYPRLPNGYGSISYLGKGRRNPYAVRPPVKAFDQDGKPIREKPIAYVDDWMKGFAILTAYHAGTYTPEMLTEYRQTPEIDDKQLLNAILKDYSTFAGKHLKTQNTTFADVFRGFYEYKYNGAKAYSDASKRSTRAAFQNCAAIHDRAFADLRHDDLQKVVDDCQLKHSSRELIVSLMHQLYAYADIYGIVSKDYSAHVRINIPDDDIHGEPFTAEDIKKLSADTDNPTACMLLIMIYSGFRVGEYKTLEINLAEGSLTGGSKTKAGKNRMVPIHPRIEPLIKRRQAFDSALISSPQAFRKEMYSYLKKAGISPHTPHDTRHTFSMLCERYGVNDVDRKRMLGHSIHDITNGVYGHRTLQDLKAEILKLP